MIVNALAAGQTQKNPAHASPHNVSCAGEEELLVGPRSPPLELPIRVRADWNFCDLALLDEPDALLSRAVGKMGDIEVFGIRRNHPERH